MMTIIAATSQRLFNMPLAYKMAVVQKQEDAVDCGLFSIANATAIALSDAETSVLHRFDQEKFRAQLELCLEEKCFTTFSNI